MAGGAENPKVEAVQKLSQLRHFLYRLDFRVFSTTSHHFDTSRSRVALSLVFMHRVGQRKSGEREGLALEFKRRSTMAGTGSAGN